MRKIRIALAILVFAAVNLFFLEITGWLPRELSIAEKLQLVPALLAGNFAVVALWAALTLVFGRVYCSVMCPLGIMQDIISHISSLRGKKYAARFSYSRERRWLRLAVLAVFVILMILGSGILLSLIEPYGAYSRIAANLAAPIVDGANNLIASVTAGGHTPLLMHADMTVRALAAVVLSLVTLAVIGFLAWRGGRTYCNTFCPVGTLLGYLSRFSLLRIRIDESRCVSCGLCEKKCKSSCIDSKNGAVDRSRCVVCMNCIDNCAKGAISYGLKSVAAQKTGQPDQSRRQFLSTTVAVTAAATLSGVAARAQQAVGSVEGKAMPDRTPVTPAGSQGVDHLLSKCVSCHLCVQKCPSHVLQISVSDYGLEGFLKPVMRFDSGYCRDNCTMCSSVCPTGAIMKVTSEAKSAIQIGLATYVPQNCLLQQGERCGNCVTRCQHGALRQVGDSIEVDASRCVGCGACEHYCPQTPFKGIYVRGNEKHVSLS